MKYLKDLPTNTLRQTHEHAGRFAAAFDGVGMTIYLSPEDANKLIKRLHNYLKYQDTEFWLATEQHNESK
jgi:hypothetical protein